MSASAAGASGLSGTQFFWLHHFPTSRWSHYRSTVSARGPMNRILRRSWSNGVRDVGKWATGAISRRTTSYPAEVAPARQDLQKRQLHGEEANPAASGKGKSSGETVQVRAGSPLRSVGRAGQTATCDACPARANGGAQMGSDGSLTEANFADKSFFGSEDVR